MDGIQWSTLFEVTADNVVEKTWHVWVLFFFFFFVFKAHTLKNKCTENVMERALDQLKTVCVHSVLKPSP